MNVQAHSLGSSPTENKEDGLWRYIKMNSVEHSMYRSIITTGRARTVGKSREVLKPKEKLRSGNIISV